MPPSPVVVEVPTSVAARPSASLTRADSAPKLMPATVIGMASSMGRDGEARAEHGLGRAALAIALERIARQGRGEKQQVVEVRHAPLRAQAADLVQAARRRALNVVDGVAVEARRFLAAAVPLMATQYS